MYLVEERATNNNAHNTSTHTRRGPVLGGPLWDILVLDLRSVDLYQDVH
jgi:hypothetical protein